MLVLTEIIPLLNPKYCGYVWEPISDSRVDNLARLKDANMIGGSYWAIIYIILIPPTEICYILAK